MLDRMSEPLNNTPMGRMDFKNVSRVMVMVLSPERRGVVRCRTRVPIVYFFFEIVSLTGKKETEKKDRLTAKTKCQVTKKTGYRNPSSLYT